MNENIDDLFKPFSKSLEGTMNCHAGRAGFKVPEYQRHYNWSHKNIKRLLEDCLSRFAHFCAASGLSRQTESYTFLGTIILVRVQNPADEGFDGTSLIVIDGQQRLTTLSLICCALIETIQGQRTALEALTEETTKSWITNEMEHQLEALFTCVSGRLTRRGKPKSYPRIIRQGDQRDYDQKAEYRSAIAKFLYDFAEYYDKDEDIFTPSWADNKESESLRNNYLYIKTQVEHLWKGEIGDKKQDVECQPIPRRDFETGNSRKLFDMRDSHFSNDERQKQENRACSEISNTQQSEGLIRLVLFASYLTKNVVLTRVETNNEDYAFDIFDALNTTGEPLTALEAFKPQVVSFEDNESQGGYSGSASKRYLDDLEKYLGKNANSRQRMTKEILISFALYHNGETLPKDLSNQRIYLQKHFRLSTGNIKQSFVAAIHQVADYQRNCWDASGIDQLQAKPGTGTTSLEILKFCLAFISGTGTKLTIPILARYWNTTNNLKQEDFIQVVKALAAFLALRRAATGGTRNIDENFRSLMKNSPHVGGDPLCRGDQHSNQLIDVGEFKKELQHYLASPKVGVKDEDTWLNLALTNPLANSSSSLCRFLIFAAAHKSTIDRDNPGFLTRDNGRSSYDFLRYGVWTDDKYQTIEHVAPSNPQDEAAHEWEGVYERQETRHLVGNIVLLPSDINSSLGNSTWSKKIACYKALASESKKDFEKIVDAAVQENSIENKAAEKLKKSHLESSRLDTLDSIIHVPHWNKELIMKRTENILRLAWQTISPWLYH